MLAVADDADEDKSVGKRDASDHLIKFLVLYTIMSAPEDQLIELLLQLKVSVYVPAPLWCLRGVYEVVQKTTPDQARAILNAQPQISYALIGLMIKMNVIDVELLTVCICSS